MTQCYQEWDLDTLLVHGGYTSRIPSTSGTPTVTPIYTSTTYLHESAEALDQAFAGTCQNGEQAFVYARQGNPNAGELEQAMAQIEKGIGAVTFGSGTAGIHAALLAAGLEAGKKIVVSQDIYSPTLSLLQKVFIPLGVEVIIENLCCPEATNCIYTEQPNVIFIETLSNPLVKVIDLDAISTAAHEVGAITIADSTFTSPYLIRPIEHNIDLVVHSTTKYISGHGDSTGGIVISAKETLLERLRTYAMLLGAMLSPFESALQLRGLRTLSLRMERHCNNAIQVARFLQEHPAIAHVYYPGLPHHPQHLLAGRIMRNNHFGGIVSFELKEQTREAALRFMNKLRLCLPAPTLGDVFTLVSYPAMSSHRTLTEQERLTMGIKEGCIRISVGIEYIEDIIHDLDQALR